MASTYRRRRYRRYRRRPIGRRYSRRIGRRRTFRRKSKWLRPKRIRGIRPYTTYDRTPNFDGDSVIAQFVETRSSGISQRIVDTYYKGTLEAGNFFTVDSVPTIAQYKDRFQYARVVKTTVKVTFNNLSPTNVQCGIMQLPVTYNNVSVLDPAWTPARPPMEEPRCVWKRLATAGTGGSPAFTTMISSGTTLSAAGDTGLITARDCDLTTDALTDAPTIPWYFYVWAGNNTSSLGGTSDTLSVNYQITSYRTVKFWGRRLSNINP